MVWFVQYGLRCPSTIARNKLDKHSTRNTVSLHYVHIYIFICLGHFLDWVLVLVLVLPTCAFDCCFVLLPFSFLVLVFCFRLCCLISLAGCVLHLALCNANKYKPGAQQSNTQAPKVWQRVFAGRLVHPCKLV